MKRQVGQKTEKRLIFPCAGFVFISTYATQVLSSVKLELLRAQSCWFLLYQGGAENGWLMLCHTCWPCSEWRRHALPDTEWRDHSCFCNLQLLKVLKKTDCKLNEKLNCCECLSHSIPTEKTCEASLFGVPFHRNQTMVLSVQTRDRPVALAN